MTVQRTAADRAPNDTGVDRRRLSFTITVVLLVAVVVILVVRRRFDPLRKLQSSTTRAIEARITAFDYAPFRRQRSAAPADNWSGLAAAGELGAALKENRSSDNLHRYALANLVLDKPAASIELLNEAVGKEPKDAAILSDLAAAQLAAGRPAEAAESAAKAAEREPKSAAAAFNWALALESLSNRRAAIKSWEQYLALDERSSWADEARARLAHLREPRRMWSDDKALLAPATSAETLQRVVHRYPQRVRLWAADELLPRWIELRRNEDLALLAAIGAARLPDDPFMRDVANDARACKPDFEAGVRAYHDGRTANRQRDLNLAGRKFNEAARLLDRAGSPLSFLATIYAASNESYRGEFAAALARVASIESRVQRYPSLGAEGEWVRGLIFARRGEHSEALQSFRRGLELAMRGADTENVVALTALIATELDELAEPEEADRYRADALRRVDAIGAAPQRTYVAFSETALNELKRHRPHVALAFVETQQALAEEARDPLLLAESASARALALRDLGRNDDALASIADSRRQALQITTEALRNRTLAETGYVDALVRRERDPDQALASLQAAMQRWQNDGWRWHVAASRLALGDIRLSRGDRRGAESDFRAGIADMEEERGALDEAKLRVAYFERADRLFERLIELLIDEKRIDEALSIAERKRSRALLDAITRDGAATPLDAASIRKALPANAALLEFELLPRAAVVWLIDGSGISAIETTARGEEIASAVERQRRAIDRNDAPAIEREARWLYRQLIAPFAAKFAANDTLIVVPDRELFALPFAALIDEKGRYLIESKQIEVAPSASLYARTVAASASKSTAVLAVAQPAPRDRVVLEHARSETEQLADVYGDASIHIGANITPREFLRRAADANIVAFAGHANDNALLFESPRNEPPVLLTTGDIMSARLPSRPLIVLAACNTGRGNVRAVEGVDSLATAFLGAGARSVVATLWDIDDAPSAHLFIQLHRSIHRGRNAPAALRDAQLEMLRSQDPRDREPASWAGVFVVGSI
jgi:CHAT domain-containing protein